MALPSRRVARRALTASASKLSSRQDSNYLKRRQKPWQLRAFDHVDLIPELHFASQFIGRMLMRVRFFPALQNEQGDLDEIKEGPPVERLNRIQDPGGGRSQLQFNYGRLMSVTGEGVLFGYRLEEPDERWKFLWNDEVKRREDGQWVRLDADKKETSDVGVGYRMWTPHPRHSDEADSPMRAVGDVAEELIILTASVMGTATTRMTHGILFVPTELSPNPESSGLDEDPEENIFLQDMIAHMTSSIENPGAPESTVPFIHEGAYEYGDRLRWMATHDPQTDYLERELRTEAIKRLALGLDMPPEALLGMTDANHWTAKQVMHDMWRSFGVVKAEQFADDLSEAYLRPALQEDEYADWDRVVIGMDDSQVVISPDRTDDADKALDRIAIGFKGYREMKGIPEEYEPTEEEREFLASLKLRQPIELDGGELIIPQRGPVAQQNGNAPEEGPPEPSGGRTGSRQESMRASGEVLGAAQMALHRCRETAGARLRRHQQTCEECQEKTDGIPNALVASVLGAEKVKELADPVRLVSGGAEGFRSILGEWGWDGTQAHSIAQMIEVHAARTLFEPSTPSLPPGFVAQVVQAEEVNRALVGD